MSRKLKLLFKKRVMGLILLSMSIGMFLVIILPAGIFIIAAAMAVSGFCLLFL